MVFSVVCVFSNWVPRNNCYIRITESQKIVLNVMNLERFHPRISEKNHDK